MEPGSGDSRRRSSPRAMDANEQSPAHPRRKRSRHRSALPPAKLPPRCVERPPTYLRLPHLIPLRRRFAGAAQLHHHTRPAGPGPCRGAASGNRPGNMPASAGLLHRVATLAHSCRTRLCVRQKTTSIGGGHPGTLTVIIPPNPPPLSDKHTAPAGRIQRPQSEQAVTQLALPSPQYTSPHRPHSAHVSATGPNKATNHSPYPPTNHYGVLPPPLFQLDPGGGCARSATRRVHYCIQRDACRQRGRAMEQHSDHLAEAPEYASGFAAGSRACTWALWTRPLDHGDKRLCERELLLTQHQPTREESQKKATGQPAAAMVRFQAEKASWASG